MITQNNKSITSKNNNNNFIYYITYFFIQRNIYKINTIPYVAFFIYCDHIFTSEGKLDGKPKDAPAADQPADAASAGRG